MRMRAGRVAAACPFGCVRSKAKWSAQEAAESVRIVARAFTLQEALTGSPVWAFHGTHSGRCVVPMWPRHLAKLLGYMMKIHDRKIGGESGIRTRDTGISRIHAFQACAFNRSAISPLKSTSNYFNQHVQRGQLLGTRFGSGRCA